MLGWVALFALAGVVHDETHGFSFEEPVGYEREQVPPPLLYQYSRGKEDPSAFGSVAISDMGHPLSPGFKLVHAKFEEGAQKKAAQTGVTLKRFDYRKLTWAGFELDLTITFSSFAGQDFVSAVVELPLQPNAVSVMAAGPAANEAQVVADLQALVTSLHGPSNWSAESPRDDALSLLLGMVLGVGGCGGAGLLVLWLATRRKPRPAP
jgi:hypothetical protein